MTSAKQEEPDEPKIVTQSEFRQLQRDLDTERRLNVTLAVGSQDKGKRIEELEAELADEKRANGVWGGKWADEVQRRCETEAERGALKATIHQLECDLDSARNIYKVTMQRAENAQSRLAEADTKLEGMRNALERIENLGIERRETDPTMTLKHIVAEAQDAIEAALDGGKEGGGE